MDDRYRSRKFALAVASLLISAAALFSKHIASGEWIAAITIVLGLYGASNVLEKSATGGHK